MISFEEAWEVLGHLESDFDSHAFIFKYIELHEREYVDLLIEKRSRHGIFRAVNSAIGRDLERFSSKQQRLPIVKAGRGNSFNIKGNITENQNWSRV